MKHMYPVRSPNAKVVIHHIVKVDSTIIYATEQRLEQLAHCGCTGH